MTTTELSNQPSKRFFIVSLNVTFYMKDHLKTTGDDFYIKGVYDVYVYDSQSHTHLCEYTPSYFLQYVYSFIDFQNIDWDDEDQRSVAEHLEGEYCYLPTDDIYMHCSDVDEIKETKENLAGKKCIDELLTPEQLDSDDKDNEILEDLVEWVQCNRRYF